MALEHTTGIYGAPVPATTARGGLSPTTTGVSSEPVRGKTQARVETFRPLIDQAARRHSIDAGLLAAVVHVESGGNPQAVSPAGAQGLTQLIPSTARYLGVQDPFDPAQSLEGAAKYLRGLLGQFHGDVSKALAAYNAGEGNVKKYGGIPPFAETQAYVPAVLAAYDTYRQPQGPRPGAPDAFRTSGIPPTLAEASASAEVDNPMPAPFRLAWPLETVLLRSPRPRDERNEIV